MAALPSAKELKKLAKACREAGISHLKSGDIEFTLTGYGPIKSAKRVKIAPIPNEDVLPQVEDSWDSLSEMDKILWSTPNHTEETV